MTERVLKGRWSDLGRRMASAVVLMGLAAVDIWTGGIWFVGMVAVLVALMAWELDRMTAPDGEALQAPGIALIAFVGLFGALGMFWPINGIILGLVALTVLATDRRNRIGATLAMVAILIAGIVLCRLQHFMGTPALLWLVGLVVASDILGYFVGRLVGGPKFWPAISPKKTWSGTIAGWVGAALVGAGFVVWCGAPAGIIWLSALLALAGQMGDIGESWMKRRAGVKDSSNLIPGHGGVMDRFDALAGASVVLFVLWQIWPGLPLPPATAVAASGDIEFSIPLAEPPAPAEPEEPALLGPRIQP